MVKSKKTKSPKTTKSSMMPMSKGMPTMKMGGGSDMMSLKAICGGTPKKKGK